VWLFAADENFNSTIVRELLALEELVLVVECSTPAEWNVRVPYLPLR
jgi:hypothetical protein